MSAEISIKRNFPLLRLKQTYSKGSYSQAVLLLLTFALGYVFSPVRQGTHIFLEWGNLADILRQVSETGVLAVGMTVLLLTGGVDLSVGATLALTATFAAKALTLWHWSVATTVLCSLSLGLGIGLFYALLISWGKIPPFVATLAGMGAFRGLARLVGDGSSLALVSQSSVIASDVGGAGGAAPDAFFLLAAKWGALSTPSLIYALVAVLTGLWLHYFVSGRHIYAVGGSEKAARFAGISITKTLLIAYGLCGVLASLSGLIHAAQLEQGNPNDGIGYELDAIAAAVIGGTRLTGGVGTVFGTVVGTLVMGVLNNVFGLNNIDINLQLILKGVLILAATILQKKRNS